MSEIANIPVTTVGLTTKVVKGSIWTLGGSVLPLAVSFISTPLIIRFLGTESYGVLLLVGLIPTYFSFADFGMGIASTKFASGAYGEGDLEKERKVVWTSATLALVSSLIIAIPLFILSFPIIVALNVPEHLQPQASIALKITAAGFVCGIVGTVVNSPMLARLRMDLNTITSALPKVVLSILTPFVLYFGGGIVEAVSCAFVFGVLGLLMAFYFSGRLLPQLFRPAFDRELLKPLVKFGGGWLVAMIASMLLINFEKLALSRMVSVKALAYYSVAFTLASMTTFFAQAMIQSLVPAFSQLLSPGKKQEFDSLVQRGMRLNTVLLLPAIVSLVLIAKPFFTLWLGTEFAEESSLPFYILAFGLFLNITAYIPYSCLLAHGRTDVFAKLYWFELVIYVVAVVVLINQFGIAGAAAAWSIRAVFDAAMVIWISNRILDVPLPIPAGGGAIVLISSILCVPLLFAVFMGNFSSWLLAIGPLSVVAYSILIWRSVLDPQEKSRIRSLVRI